MNKKYKHGILWQDHQHEQLIDCISSLNHKRGTSYESSELATTIVFLEFYVKTHFDLEEEYMETLEYSDINHHKLQHKKFIHMINNFKESRKVNTSSSELVTELCTWFKNHIMEIDKDLAKFIKNHGK